MVSREFLFLDSDVVANKQLQSLRKHFPEGSLEIDTFIGDEGCIFTHTSLNSYKQGIYYFDGDQVCALCGEGVYFPRYEKEHNLYSSAGDYKYILWSGTLDLEGKNRILLEYSVSTQASRCVERKNLDSFIIDVNGRVIAGCKNLGNGEIEYWIKASERWSLFRTADDKSIFSPNFNYNGDEDRLYYISCEQDSISIEPIDLRVNRAMPSSSLKKEGGATYYPMSSFDPYDETLGYYSYVKAGRTYWTGNSLFNYIYKDLHDQLRIALGQREFYIDNLFASSKYPWSFTLIFQTEPPLLGFYNLESRQLRFIDEKRQKREI